MLTKITIGNFRSFLDNQTIVIANEHATVCALYGPNGSGKSNVIRAIRTVRSIIIHSADAGQRLPYEPFGFNKMSRIAPCFFSIEVVDGDSVIDYSFSFTSLRIVNECLRLKSDNTNKYRILFDRNENRILNTSSLNFGFGSKLLQRTLPKTLLITKAYEDNNMYAVSIVKALEKLIILTMNSQELEREAADILLNNRRIKDKVCSSLSEFDPSIIDIQSHHASFPKELIDAMPLDATLKEYYYRNGNIDTKIIKRYKDCIFPQDVSEESAGIKSIITVLTLMYYCIENEFMLCIDEFGNYIHPFIAKKLVDLYESCNPKKPLIISSHQLSVFSNLKWSERVIVTKDSQTGKTLISNRKKNASLRKINNDNKIADNYFGYLIEFGN